MSIIDTMLSPYPSPKPFIKWAGGKQSLVPKLIQIFPTDFTCLYEPFVGGGSVFLSLSAEKTVISDHNRWLIDTYTAIRDDWKKVAKALDKLPNDKESYLKIRSVLPETLKPIDRAAHFIYLNKTCFRGLFRVNQKGQFNVPYGEYDRRYYDPDNLESVSHSLQSVDIRCGDFEDTLSDVKKNAFVYFDPPYYKFGGHADFNRYTELQFREQDHQRLADVCRRLDNKRVRWAVSNSNTDFVRDLFEGFTITEIGARREINLKSQKRDITELVITNY